MAPDPRYDGVNSQYISLNGQIDSAQDQLKVVIQNLYNLIVQGIEHQGPATQEAMKREIQSLVANLITLTRNAPNYDIAIPVEIVQYVENSRNPLIFNRELVEAVQRKNQLLKARCEAFAQMRDILAKDIIGSIPELKDDVKRVVESTGGKIDS